MHKYIAKYEVVDNFGNALVTVQIFLFFLQTISMHLSDRALNFYCKVHETYTKSTAIL